MAINELAFSSLLPRVRLVRRRGFSLYVRRGALVLYHNKTWVVVRRTAKSLWITAYEPPLEAGTVIRLRVPSRFRTHIGEGGA